MKKKILILYTSAGLGHKHIAYNIGYYLEENYDVKYVDVFHMGKEKDNSSVLMGLWLHKVINKYFGFVWKFLYNSKLTLLFGMPLRERVAEKYVSQLQLILKEFSADMIITTQTSASALVSVMKRKKIFNGKFIICFSDYHFHEFWHYDLADAYAVNIGMQKQRLVDLGFDENKIYQLGITLKPQNNYDVNMVKTEMQIDVNKEVLLILTGSMGIGFDEEWIKYFVIEAVKQLQLFVVIATGQNLYMNEKLSKSFIYNDSVRVVGYQDDMPKLYSIADVVVTKPGGLTIAELVSRKKRIFISYILPGQEEHNINYLKDLKLIEGDFTYLTTQKATKQFVKQYKDGKEVGIATPEFILSSQQSNSLINRMVSECFTE